MKKTVGLRGRGWDHRGAWLRSLVLALAGCGVAGPSLALYKVVGPDGKVTYTDTPPPPSSGSKVTQLGAGAQVVGDAALPLELRQASQRFPVTLYTTRVCEPCESARTLLRQRGVPFTEKLVLTADDADALARLAGTRDTPAATIGGQVLRGYSADAWTSYLDTAGYPRESRLPSGYQYPAARPLTEPPAPPSAPPARPAIPAAAAPPGERAAPAAGGIRF